MKFKKYSSIENGYHEKFITFVKEHPEFNEVTWQVTEKIDGCLEENILVTTREYGDMPIKLLVDMNYRGDVLSVNHNTNELEWDEVVNSSVEELGDKEWFKIETSDGEILLITGNHRVWSANRNEYVRCDELTLDDTLLKM